MASVLDIRTGKIPNYLSLGAFLLILALYGSTGQEKIIPFLSSSIISFLIMAAVSLLTNNRLGMGDAKLSLVMGGMLGFYYWCLSLLAASLAALAYVLPLLAMGKLKRTDPIPFAPFLSLGALLALWLKKEGYFFF